MNDRIKQKYLEEFKSLQSFIYDVAEDVLNNTSDEEIEDLPAPEELMAGILDEITSNPEDLPDYEPLVAEVDKDSVMFEIEEGLAVPLYSGEPSEEEWSYYNILYLLIIQTLHVGMNLGFKNILLTVGIFITNQNIVY